MTMAVVLPNLNNSTRLWNDTQRALVGERGWASEEYERWLARVLGCALLAELSSSA